MGDEWLHTLSKGMKRAAYTKSVSVILACVLLLAQFICFCGSAHAWQGQPENAAVGEAASAVHPCCNSGATPRDNDSDKLPVDHHPGCQHCGEAEALTKPDAPARVNQPVEVAIVIWLNVNAHLSIVEVDQKVLFSTQQKPVYFSEPHALLRKKCTLQI